MTSNLGSASSERTASESVAPAKLAHVVLRTSRYSETVDYYKKLLNAHATFESPMLTFLTYDDEHHRQLCT